MKFSFRVLIVIYFKWPHNTGPLMAYMGDCGAVTCDKVDPQKMKWFKISQLGKKSPTTWFQQDICTFSKLLSQHLQVISSLFFSFRCSCGWWKAKCRSKYPKKSQTWKLHAPIRHHRSPSSQPIQRS